MNFENEPANNRSVIFTDNEAAFRFLLYIGLLENRKNCGVNCIGEMRFEHDPSYTSGYRLRCSSCRKSQSILKGSNFENPKINFSEYLFIIYSWLEKNFEYNIDKNSNASLNSIKRIKRKIIALITAENERDHRKIGQFEPVQVDESVIIKGKLIKSPSAMYDTVKRATWIVGAVEETTRELVLEVVPNRKKETMRDFFKRNIKKKAIVKTDGHRSYPYSVEGIEGDHIIVNHEQGFTNNEGHHTNLIECEWSLFKTDIKTRKGVPGFAMGGYVEEYVWRRRNMRKRSSDAFRRAFIKIVKLFLQNKK